MSQLVIPRQQREFRPKMATLVVREAMVIVIVLLITSTVCLTIDKSVNHQRVIAAIITIVVAIGTSSAVIAVVEKDSLAVMTIFLEAINLLARDKKYYDYDDELGSIANSTLNRVNAVSGAVVGVAFGGIASATTSIAIVWISPTFQTLITTLELWRVIVIVPIIILSALFVPGYMGFRTIRDVFQVYKSKVKKPVILAVVVLTMLVNFGILYYLPKLT
jgi:hypothetical protein